ncbi:uncharacterized protein Z520_11138 [Fonsecaea multimorphosa CBS 102226]|uniref:Uncharacterized protein n=1 Tax=Fonsecaea multimorphosa CBS 102226 TaxID=1442371 RepID=A0A0D2I776_9EURO|nr:uncharacterized protein Z520_11138 [Fonsecaea multimorphosa CBS 102226]KIX93081.1 hypothetical protein Z520_11138 [Fonsecaea multimorphosa CBS 102226]
MAWKTSMSTFIGERVHTITLIVMSTAALSPKEYAQPSKSTCRPLLSVQKSMHYHQIQPVDRCAQSKRVCTTIKVNLSTAALSQTEYAQHPELNLSTAALSQTRVCTTSRTQPEVYQNVKVTQCLPSRYSQSTRVCTTSQSQAEVKKCDILQNLPTTALAPIEHIAFKPSSTRSHPNTQGPQDLLATTPTEHPKLKLSSTKIRHGFQVPEISCDHRSSSNRASTTLPTVFSLDSIKISRPPNQIKTYQIQGSRKLSTAAVTSSEQVRIERCQPDNPQTQGPRDLLSTAALVL